MFHFAHPSGRWRNTPSDLDTLPYTEAEALCGAYVSWMSIVYAAAEAPGRICDMCTLLGCLDAPTPDTKNE